MHTVLVPQSSDGYPGDVEIILDRAANESDVCRDIATSFGAYANAARYAAGLAVAELELSEAEDTSATVRVDLTGRVAAAVRSQARP